MIEAFVSLGASGKIDDMHHLAEILQTCILEKAGEHWDNPVIQAIGREAIARETQRPVNHATDLLIGRFIRHAPLELGEAQYTARAQDAQAFREDRKSVV